MTDLLIKRVKFLYRRKAYLNIIAERKLAYYEGNPKECVSGIKEDFSVKDEDEKGQKGKTANRKKSKSVNKWTCIIAREMSCEGRLIIMDFCYLTSEGTVCLHAFLSPHTVLAGIYMAC